MPHLYPVPSTVDKSVHSVPSVVYPMFDTTITQRLSSNVNMVWCLFFFISCSAKEWRFSPKPHLMAGYIIATTNLQISTGEIKLDFARK